MAITYVGAGAVSTGGAPSVIFGVPSGVSAGNFMLMAFTQDANENEIAISGWTFIGRATPGPSGGSLASPHTVLYYRIANSHEPVLYTVSFSSDPWPAGQASVTGVILAWSGVDTSAPIEVSGSATATHPAAATQAHPQLTTQVSGDWLVTIRGNSGSTYATTTDSVGTDVSRADYQNSSYPLTVVAFDSAGPLPAGTQTQVTTTTSSGTDMGSVMWSLALKPAGTAAAQVVLAPSANALGLAQTPSVTAQDLPWDCSAELPRYLLAIDWEQQGLTAPGEPLTFNGHFLRDLSGWFGNNATVSPAQVPLSGRTFNTALVVPNGTSVSGGLNATLGVPVVGGQPYIAQAWVWQTTGWTDQETAIDWYNASGTYISSGIGSPVSCPAGQWTQLQQSFTAPGSAATAVVRARHGSTAPSSAAYYAWGVVLFDPSQATTALNPYPNALVNPDLMDAGITTTLGRDMARQINPAQLGTANVTVNNSNRNYSPENPSGVFAGSLDAARDTGLAATYGGQVYPLFRGMINNFTLNLDRNARTVGFSFQDAQGRVQNNKISTPVYAGKRTGELISIVLETAGWTGPTDIDPGGTVVSYWWLDMVQASSAISDLVNSEGPPSIAYVAQDGTFVFRDRHHRLVREQSTQVQAVFAQGMLGDDACASTPPEGATIYDFSFPFTYDHGLANIINKVEFDVATYQVDGVYAAVWTSQATYTVQVGQTLQIIASAGGPFIDAITPQAGTDYTATGLGLLSVSLDRDSGSSCTISLTATGSVMQVTNLQIRAYAIQSSSTVKVLLSDTTSIQEHGEQDYPNAAPWAGVEDATAIANMILFKYAQRLPSVTLTVNSENPAHWLQVAARTISDLVTIRFDEMSLDANFYIESISHDVQRLNPPGQPPVHSVVLGCEEVLFTSANPFTFDQRGAGFDAGTFDPIVTDASATVWIWDDQSAFDVNLFGT